MIIGTIGVVFAASTVRTDDVLSTAVQCTVSYEIPIFFIRVKNEL